MDNIEHSLENYREFLQGFSPSELNERASEAEKQGRKWTAEFIREIASTIHSEELTAVG